MTSLITSKLNLSPASRRKFEPFLAHALKRIR